MKRKLSFAKRAVPVTLAVLLAATPLDACIPTNPAANRVDERVF